MPTYTYQVVTDDGSEGEIFEIEQRMAEAALTAHPETGVPVRRILLSPPAIAGGWSEAGASNRLSDANLERHGFSKFVRSSDNTWDKTAGAGPKQIERA